MIFLQKDQRLLTDPDWAVKTEGEYDEQELVTVYRVSDPKQEVAYFAIFIEQGLFQKESEQQ